MMLPLSLANCERASRYTSSRDYFTHPCRRHTVYFEKGAGYYLANAFFLMKFTLFILAALISIYPTVLFISWNKALKQGEVPVITPQAATRARMCMMLEMTAILGILLCAPFMARGIGLLR
jgi:putative membrane protein